MRFRWLIALCLAIFLASLMVITVFAGAPSPVTDLRVQRSGTSAVLTWTHTDSTVHHYEVWWSDSPYAVPGDAGMVKIADVTPGAAPSEATYTDTASGVGNHRGQQLLRGARGERRRRDSSLLQPRR